MKWIRRVVLIALVAVIGLAWFARPASAFRSGNVCKSDKDCDSGLVCFIWSNGSKSCESPPQGPGNDPPPADVPTPRACHSTKECDSGMKCLTTGSQDPTTGGCVGGAVGTPGVCSPPWCLP